MAPLTPNKPSALELRAMYVDQLMTTRQIGKRFGVRHITVRRWLQGYEIPARASADQLAHRGLAKPPAETLRALVWDERLTYRQIAERFGVDFTCIPYWLDSYGIRKPTVWGTRYGDQAPQLPSRDDLAARRARGESLRVIAADVGVGHGVISRLFREYGLEIDRDGWLGGKRFACVDGHEARSTYEQRVDDWLHAHSLYHITEPQYPFDRRYRADFLVGDTFIEVWGVTQNPAYTARKRWKIERCKERNLDLIQVNYGQFAKGRQWWRPLNRLLTDPRSAP